jgi:two-component system cell cycle sensor histidine kinase/response regulator CckA
MKPVPKVLALTILAVVTVWMADAAVDGLLLHQGPVLRLLVRPPVEALGTRLVASVALLILGYVASSFAMRARKADEVREDIRNRYAMILATTSDAALAADLEGRITAFNPGAERIFGYTAAEIVGRPIAVLSPDDALEEQATTWSRLFETGSISGLEAERLTKDGRRLRVELTINVTRDARGRPTGTAAVIRDVTERRRSEEALRESESRLRRIFRVAPVGIGVARNRVLLEVNDQLCEMVGRTREELVDRESRILYPSDEEYARVAREREIQAATQEIVSVYTLWQHRDGRIRNVIMNSSYLERGDPGKGAIFAVRDVTEQVRSRRELEEQHLQLEQAQELARVGSWAFDLDADRVTGSREAMRIYGLTGESWSISEIQSIPLPEHRETLDRAFADLVRRGKPYDETFSLRRRSDGEIRTVHSIARFDRENNRVLGVIQDITDQRTAEEAVRASEQRFRSVVEQSSQAIYVLVGDQFELVNPRFCEMTGVTAEEACAPGFDFHDLLAPESLRIVEERRLGRQRHETLSESYEFAIRHRSGRTVQVSASVAPIRYRGHDAVLGFLQDITAQKTLEAQLDQALRMESIGRLSGGVAHDLNNLLSPVLGYAELLLEDLSAGDARRSSAEAILQAGIRARDLVRQLLAFSRQQPLEMGTVDLNTMLRDFESLLRRTLREDIRIELDLQAGTPLVIADRTQLERVVMNLAVNAQDAMPEGGILTLRTRSAVLDESFIATHPGSKPGCFEVLEVADTGEGMDAETRRRIFEPFFTTKPKGKGTGLGLSTVYGIVKQHDGYIAVDSVAGRGATFSCYFYEAEGAGSDRVSPADSLVQPGGTETVLVVEDEELVRDLVVGVLGRQGYEVLAAGSGEEAISLFQGLDGHVDLLLTDVVLPGINGRELHQRIHDLSPRTRVLFMSGYAGDVISERGVLTDETLIQKPFSTEALATRVRDTLDAAGD